MRVSFPFVENGHSYCELPAEGRSVKDDDENCTSLPLFYFCGEPTS
jgi:hypothetical protein